MPVDVKTLGRNSHSLCLRFFRRRTNENYNYGLLFNPKCGCLWMERSKLLHFFSTTREIITPERNEEWFDLRKVLFTPSSFASALGFRKEGRVGLWEEKVGTKRSFSGNAITEWRVLRMADAISKYEDMSGHFVEHIDFQVYKGSSGNNGSCWLGTSSDGIVNGGLFGTHPKGGILEVKCPLNKGNPRRTEPPSFFYYMYMPQVQGIMEILDREWLDLFVWTVNGVVLHRVRRDKAYWSRVVLVLEEFWFGHVIPARKALSLGEIGTDLNQFKPAVTHGLTKELIKDSETLANESELIFRHAREKRNTTFG